MSERETRNVRFNTPDWYALPQQGWRTIHMSFPHLSEDEDRLRTAVFIMQAPEAPMSATDTIDARLPAFTWEATTDDRYTEMLEILPPEVQYGSHYAGGFLVGEPSSHRDSPFGFGPTFAAYLRIEEAYYVCSAPLTIAEFKAVYDLVIRKEVMVTIEWVQPAVTARLTRASLAECFPDDVGDRLDILTAFAMGGKAVLHGGGAAAATIIRAEEDAPKWGVWCMRAQTPAAGQQEWWMRHPAHRIEWEGTEAEARAMLATIVTNGDTSYEARPRV